ncbi:hypothetical protein P4H27_12700 [Paenibacillus taichungensis]|uniref:hypothetical protein n=1 Tax=Paenibacillus TaxID=44249 RepID=UPI00096E6924|nr:MULTISPECIES: hypothetical protein [Paenibacillus]OME82543.1 hypothetical protein BK122_11320 [Paenibacillus pabuli]MDR9746615.1 hypothetical protein [Paenibacillus taichungensis]MEC0107806.1 hypothetical protein [Paenibacillus taichungensis]MEC0200646.1 hypothetical protein [Paenibacillus taichungensis]PIH56976.1 hypothetical protein CS562_22800 [Paenibacillus sp. LK1]
MRKYIYVIGCMTLLFMCLTGCSADNIQSKGNQVIVQQPVENSNQYTLYRKITDPAQVHAIRSITRSIRSNHIIADMVRPPDYKFFFEKKNTTSSDKSDIYNLWISPHQDQVEIIIESKPTYVQLTKEKSAKLFELITGEKLPGYVE